MYLGLQLTAVVFARSICVCFHFCLGKPVFIATMLRKCPVGDASSNLKSSWTKYQEMNFRSPRHCASIFSFLGDAHEKNLTCKPSLRGVSEGLRPRSYFAQPEINCLLKTGTKVPRSPYTVEDHTASNSATFGCRTSEASGVKINRIGRRYVVRICLIPIKHEHC